jgi:hypothetical protein
VLAPPVATDDNEDEDKFLLPTSLLDEDHQINCDTNDMIPFDTEVQDDDSDMDLFHDVGTWEDDEEEEEDRRTGTL